MGGSDALPAWSPQACPQELPPRSQTPLPVQGPPPREPMSPAEAVRPFLVAPRWWYAAQPALLCLSTTQRSSYPPRKWQYTALIIALPPTTGSAKAALQVTYIRIGAARAIHKASNTILDKSKYLQGNTPSHFSKVSLFQQCEKKQGKGHCARSSWHRKNKGVVRKPLKIFTSSSS